MTLLVLGLGNDLLGDDGVGLRVADAVAREGLREVQVQKSAVAGLYLIDLLEGFDDLIVVDSVPGDPTGAVLELDLRKFVALAPSAHYAGLPEALGLAEAAGMQVPRRVAIVAVTIGGAQTVGADIDPSVAAAVPGAVAQVLRIARQWGHGGEPPPAPSSTRRRKGRRA